MIEFVHGSGHCRMIKAVSGKCLNDSVKIEDCRTCGAKGMGRAKQSTTDDSWPSTGANSTDNSWPVSHGTKRTSKTWNYIHKNVQKQQKGISRALFYTIFHKMQCNKYLNEHKQPKHCATSYDPPYDLLKNHRKIIHTSHYLLRSNADVVSKKYIEQNLTLLSLKT